MSIKKNSKDNKVKKENKNAWASSNSAVEANVDETSRDSSTSKFNFRKYQKRNQNFREIGGGKKVSTKILIKKPEKTWWIRVHPTLSVEMSLYKDEANGTWFAVHEDLQEVLANDLSNTILHLAVTSQGTLFFWPIKYNPNASKNSWTESALEAVESARKGWVRVASNSHARIYDVYSPQSALDDPVWENEDINVLLSRAFGQNLIRDLDHPIVKDLQGRS